MVLGNKAAIWIASHESPVMPADLGNVLPRSGENPPLTGQVLCPKGCGTRIYWALSAELAEHKETFLNYLNQQLSWTECPEHRQFRRQRLSREEWDWARPFSSRFVLGQGLYYGNCYE